MKEIAIIGPTASGKSDLALRLATKHNAFILSIDSLSIYKMIDIASAKPSSEDLNQVRHFGINRLYPDEHFNVSTFIDCYRQAREAAHAERKNLIIVGGTGFYLKALLNGLSDIPSYSASTISKVQKQLQDLPSAYALLHKADPLYMHRIEATDAYRIEKLLLLYLESGQSPSQWFASHPPKPIITDLDLFEIDSDRHYLRERILRRTEQMLRLGLIDEVAELEYRYGRHPNSMKAIGIIEVLEYLDGWVGREEMKTKIITHTAQLAKRQQTFNRHQFRTKRVLPLEKIHDEAVKLLQDSIHSGSTYKSHQPGQP